MGAARPEPPEADERPEGRVAVLKARAEVLADEARGRVEDARRRYPAVGRAFDIFDRDAERFGGLFAGALAYRLFLWLVPFVLLSVGLLGALTDADGGTPEAIVGDFGLEGALAESVLEGARQRGWWIAILVGLSGILWAGVSATKALRISHAAAWGIPRPPAGSPLRATLWFAAGVLSLIAASVVAARLREADGATGLVATLLVGLIYVGIWTVVSSHLPRRPGPLRELVPGAVLFGVGMEAVHIFTAYYLVDRAERAESTYGAIGTALVALLWLYVVSRLVVGSAVVNAEFARHARARREAAEERE